MSRAIADTSLFIAAETGRSLAEHLVPDELAVSVVTLGELRAGVLAAADASVRDARLVTFSNALSLGIPLSIDRAVADVWARLCVMLRDARRRMPVNDSWIAATAMLLDVPVVTQDADYDVGLSKLAVIHV